MDGVDFLLTNEEEAKRLIPIIFETLIPSSNLKVNTPKTEITVVKRETTE